MEKGTGVLADAFGQLSIATEEAARAFKQFSYIYGKAPKFLRINLAIWRCKVRLFWLYRRVVRKIKHG